MLNSIIVEGSKKGTLNYSVGRPVLLLLLLQNELVALSDKTKFLSN